MTQDDDKLKTRVLGALASHGMTDVPEDMVDEGIELIRNPDLMLRGAVLLAKAMRMRQTERFQLCADDQAIIRAYTLVAPDRVSFDRDIVDLAKTMMAIAFVWLEEHP